MAYEINELLGEHGDIVDVYTSLEDLNSLIKKLEDMQEEYDDELTYFIKALKRYREKVERKQ